MFLESAPAWVGGRSYFEMKSCNQKAEAVGMLSRDKEIT